MKSLDIQCESGQATRWKPDGTTHAETNVKRSLYLAIKTQLSPFLDEAILIKIVTPYQTLGSVPRKTLCTYCQFGSESLFYAFAYSSSGPRYVWVLISSVT